MSAKRRRTPSKNPASAVNKQTSRGHTQLGKASAASQVRIIGGQFKRQLVPFIDADGLRPSPDRLRETLFNWVQFELHDANVLDLCAGSGVLGFEALSRGANYVTFIERQPNQAKLIAQTSEKLKLPAASFNVHIGDALTIIPTLKKQQTNKSFAYHFVFVDPPYDLDLWAPLIKSLINDKLVNADTLFYVEDRRKINQTLQALQCDYTVRKETKIGQIFASLIQLEI